MEETKVKTLFFRAVSILIFIIGLFICPPKSVSFDNLINASKTLTALGLALLAYYLWNFDKRNKGQ